MAWVESFCLAIYNLEPIGSNFNVQQHQIDQLYFLLHLYLFTTASFTKLTEKLKQYASFESNKKIIHNRSLNFDVNIELILIHHISLKILKLRYRLKRAREVRLKVKKAPFFSPYQNFKRLRSFCKISNCAISLIFNIDTSVKFLLEQQI